MNSSSAILICDREHLFRDTLKNFLLAAGYSRVEVVATAQEALVKLRRERYGYVFIGISRPVSCARRLASIVQRRQPSAKVVLLSTPEDLDALKDFGYDCIVKEYAFSSSLKLLEE